MLLPVQHRLERMIGTGTDRVDQYSSATEDARYVPTIAPTNPSAFKNSSNLVENLFQRVHKRFSRQFKATHLNSDVNETSFGMSSTDDFATAVSGSGFPFLNQLFRFAELSTAAAVTCAFSSIMGGVPPVGS